MPGKKAVAAIRAIGEGSCFQGILIAL